VGSSMHAQSSVEWQRDVPDGSWDRQLMSRGGNFLQSTHWGAFRMALGQTVFFGQGDGWQCVALVQRAHRVMRLYCPYGPVAEDRASFERAVAGLRQLAHREGAIFARTEPIAPITETDLRQLGHKPALKSMQPAHTWVQDLTKSREALFNEFSANNRNRYRGAAKKGISITQSTTPGDVGILLRMLHDVADRVGAKMHDDEYFRIMAEVIMGRDAATLYVAWHEGEPVAASLAFDTSTTRFYAYSGNAVRARKLHPGAPLLATMILDAKDRGQRTFDFCGAAPPDEPDHPWAGFTQFKQSFGGEYRTFLGTWEAAFSPLYHAYRSTYKISNLFTGSDDTPVSA
jgi:hypothetical protein